MPKVAEAGAREREVRALLAQVLDPEIPVLSIVDLGIVREVRQEADGRIRVAITPTYSGCPATEVIRRLVRARYSSSAPLAAPTAVEARHDGMLQSIGTAKPGFAA